MNRMQKLVVAAFSLPLSALLAQPANASSVTLSAAGQNLLDVFFSMPAQPGQHNALNIGVTTASYGERYRLHITSPAPRGRAAVVLRIERPRRHRGAPTPGGITLAAC